MEHLIKTNCPICGSDAQGEKRTIKDHMITQEEFNVVKCESCGFVYTNPRPNEDVIGSYYKSEEYVSHSSTKKGLVNRLYNLVRSYTLKKKTKLLGEITTGKELLDIGSGTGHFVDACKKAGFTIEGLEPDEDARRFCKTEFGIELKPLEVLNKIPVGSKDLITMWHVLEHVYHLQRDFEKISHILKDNGRLVIGVPNHESYDAEVYGNGWAAYDVPRHLYHFRKDDISKLANQHGMKLEKVVPMKFDSYYVSMLSEKYKKGSNLKAVLNGFKSNRRAKIQGYSSQIYILSKTK